MIARRTLLGITAAALSSAPVLSQQVPQRRWHRRQFQQYAVRERWTDSREYFLSPTGDDDNSGTTPGTAWATPKFAHDFMFWNHDLSGHIVYMRFAPGTYVGARGQLKAWGMLTGQQHNGAYQWCGVNGDPGAVKLQGYGFHAHDNALFFIQNVEISTNDTAAIGASFGSVEISRVRFPNVGARYHILSRNSGFVLALDDYELIGNAGRHICTQDGGTVNISKNIAIAPGVAIAEAFAMPQSGSINLIGASFTGSFIGRNFRCLDGGCVRTGTGNLFFIPGSIAGMTTSGGVVSGFYS